MTSTSSLRLGLNSLKMTPTLFARVLKRAWLVLLILHAVQFAVSQSLSYAAEVLRESGHEDILFIAVTSLIEFVFTMLWSAVWLIAISRFAQFTSNQDPSENLESLSSRLNQLVIESVRSLASVIWRLPLLLLPALTQYIRLTLVPFVVILNPAYAAGRVDALKESHKLSRGHFWLLCITVAVSVALPALIENLAQGSGSQWVWQNPLGVGTGALLNFAIDLACTIFLFNLFQALNRQS